MPHRGSVEKCDPEKLARECQNNEDMEKCKSMIHLDFARHLLTQIIDKLSHKDLEKLTIDRWVHPWLKSLVVPYKIRIFKRKINYIT